jgi:signal peptide peptidase SppA
MKHLPNLASLVFNQPLLITPQYAETLAVVLSDRIGINAEDLSISSGPANKREEKLVGRGVYSIPVVGSMSHRATGIEAMSGMTSYNTLRGQLAEAFDNPSVAAVVLDMDSPGGAVSGAFDLRDFLLEQRGKKPFYAISRDSMFSAAYLLGSTADKVYTTQTGGVGSIGVVAMHLDQSKRNEMQGVKPTFIYAGDYKVAGNPHEPLEGEALKQIQESVNESYDMFVKAVASARSIEEAMVRDTQARTYRGKKAVNVGLSDGVKSYESLIAEASENLPKTYKSVAVKPTATLPNKGKTMENEQLSEALVAAEAKLAEALSELSDVKAAKENLTKMILDEGYSITKESLVKPAPVETLEIDGVQVDKASLPDVVVKALQEKSQNELQAAATNTFPNLKADVALNLYKAFKDSPEMVKSLASLNSAVGEMLEEKGDKNPGAELMSAEDKMNTLVNAHMKATGDNKYKAYAAVSATPEGAKLLQDIYKEKE